jgi:hypothetical protein
VPLFVIKTVDHLSRHSVLFSLRVPLRGPEFGEVLVTTAYLFLNLRV